MDTIRVCRGTIEAGVALPGSGPSALGNSGNFSDRSGDQSGGGILSRSANYSSTAMGMPGDLSHFVAQAGAAHSSDLPGDPESFWPQIATGSRRRFLAIRDLSKWQKFRCKNCLNANWDSGQHICIATAKMVASGAVDLGGAP